MFVQALCAGDFCALMELTEMIDFETMLTNDMESMYEQCTDSIVEAVFPYLEITACAEYPFQWTLYFTFPLTSFFPKKFLNLGEM